MCGSATLRRTYNACCYFRNRRHFSRNSARYKPACEFHHCAVGKADAIGLCLRYCATLQRGCFVMGFMPDPAVLLAFAAASVLLILTPGPDMTLLIGRALSSGRGAASACVGGTIIGLMAHTMLVALGVAALVVASPAAFLVLKTVGAATCFGWLFRPCCVAQNFTSATPVRKAATSEHCLQTGQTVCPSTCSIQKSLYSS